MNASPLLITLSLLFLGVRSLSAITISLNSPDFWLANDGGHNRQNCNYDGYAYHSVNAVNGQRCVEYRFDFTRGGGYFDFILDGFFDSTTLRLAEDSSGMLIIRSTLNPNPDPTSGWSSYSELTGSGTAALVDGHDYRMELRSCQKADGQISFDLEITGLTDPAWVIVTSEEETTYTDALPNNWGYSGFAFKGTCPIAPIPEPSSALLGLLSGGILALRRQRHFPKVVRGRSRH